MKRIGFCWIPVFLILTNSFFLIGCGGKNEAAVSSRTDGASAAAVGVENPAAAENREIAEESRQEAVQVSQDSVVKPKELDAAVEKLVQKALKENPGLEKLEAPIQMTYFFIRALQTNNEQAIRGMLTRDAFCEMKNEKGMPCPDFIQNSEVELGNVQYLTDENDEDKVVGARVGTTWHVKSREGETLEDIAWVFRFEDDAWLVAGMISILDPKYPPMLINFEDMKETEKEYAAFVKEVERIEMENSGKNANVAEDEVADESKDVKEEESANAVSAEKAVAKAKKTEEQAELSGNISVNAEELEKNGDDANESKDELPSELPTELP